MFNHESEDACGFQDRRRLVLQQSDVVPGSRRRSGKTMRTGGIEAAPQPVRPRLPPAGDD